MFVTVWDVWVERATIPFFEMRVFGMFGVGHGVKELFVSGEAAHILWRA